MKTNEQDKKPITHYVMLEPGEKIIVLTDKVAGDTPALIAVYVDLTGMARCVFANFQNQVCGATIPPL